VHPENDAGSATGTGGPRAPTQEEELTMEEVLDAKTQLLVALGAATAAKCQHCFTMLYGTAGKLDVSDKEVRAAVAIATKVAAKSRDFMAAFIEEATKGAIPARSGDGAAAGCGCS
jgi:alkylhydroperoxidase/carboxymuconolactone decarboxylase family protein YurZ